MRYLGGKTQISKALAAEVNVFRRGRPFWDPFCGSLAMSRALGGAGFVSDRHPALMALYVAIANGWDPPETLSREEWAAAKDLPDTNPLKGFAGFGCSYRGLFFCGYAGGYVGPTSNFGAHAARKVLKRDVMELVARTCRFGCMDFLSEPARPGVMLYLDPPYANTAGYAGVPPFDRERFCARVEEWASFGPVCVSEYHFPLGRVVWERHRAVKMTAGSGAQALERLYVVGA